LATFTLCLDLNNNGSLDPTEPSAVTNAAGGFSFTVLPGVYTLRELPRTSWTQTSPWPTLKYIVNVAASGMFIAGQDFGNAVTGDANGDRLVDQADFVIWYNNYGRTPAVWTQADFNFDSLVDQADYVLWYNNYGYAGAAGSAGASALVQATIAPSSQKPARGVAAAAAQWKASTSRQFRDAFSVGSNKDVLDLLAVIQPLEGVLR
jgi:hypothetical protein